MAYSGPQITFISFFPTRKSDLSKWFQENRQWRPEIINKSINLSTGFIMFNSYQPIPKLPSQANTNFTRQQQSKLFLAYGNTWIVPATYVRRDSRKSTVNEIGVHVVQLCKKHPQIRWSQNRKWSPCFVVQAQFQNHWQFRKTCHDIDHFFTQIPSQIYVNLSW